MPSFWIVPTGCLLRRMPDREGPHVARLGGNHASGGARVWLRLSPQTGDRRGSRAPRLVREKHEQDSCGHGRKPARRKPPCQPPLFLPRGDNDDHWAAQEIYHRQFELGVQYVLLDVPRREIKLLCHAIIRSERPPWADKDPKRDRH